MSKIDTKKLLPRASKANTFSQESVQNISVIASKLIDVNTILKGSLALDEIRKKKERKAKEKKERSAKEKLREGLKGAAKGVGKTIGKKAEGVMGWLNRLIFGVVMISLFKLLPVIKPILPALGTAFDGLVQVVGWLANAAMTLIDWMYKLYDGLRSMVKNIFGEAGLKVFDNLMAVLNNFMNLAIMGVMALLKFKWLRNFAKNITKRITKRLLEIPGVKNAVRKGKAKIGRLIGRGGRKFLKSVGKKGLKKTITGGLKKGAVKGAQKIGGFAVKLFGKAAKFIAPGFKAAKPFVSKFFGRVPIVGPLIVGIVSLLSGEGAGKAIFKMVGAALGGFLGASLAAGVTTATVGIGALVSPAMVMLGELIGVFVGDMLYDLIFGGGLASIMGKLKKLVGDVFKKALNIGGAIVDFIKNGLSTFIKDFPTIPIPDIKPGGILGSIIEKMPGGKRLLDFTIPGWIPFIGGKGIGSILEGLPGLQEVLGFFAQVVPGLNNYVEDGKLTKIPNFLLFTPPGLPFLIPHVAKSFFGGKDKSEAPKGTAKDVKSDSGKKKKEDKGLNQKKLISYLKFKSEEKHAKEEQKKKEAAALKEKQKTDLTSKIEAFMAKSLDSKTDSIAKKSPDDKSDSLKEYPSYDSQAPQTAMIPLPPAILPVDQGASSVGGGGSGGGEDPFEVLYVGGLV